MPMLAGLGQLETVGASGGGNIDPRLKPAAHEFEACLMKEFLKPLQKDALSGEGKDAAGDDGGEDALMGFGSEALSRAISERGGFGIATKIIEQLEGKSGRRTESENSFGAGGKK